MELEYVKNGNYCIPALRANEEPDEPLTKWGLMHRSFLKEHRRGIYSGMMLEGTLKEHCLSIQHQAEERMDVIVEQMAGIPYNIGYLLLLYAKTAEFY